MQVESPQQQQSKEQKSIPIDQLHPKQLLAIKKSLEEEVMMLNQSMNQFKLAMSKYEESKSILKNLQTCEQHQELLVPITSSLYVPGYIESNQKVLIDLGTGYFVERDSEQAQQFCQRKLLLLKENAEKLQNLITQKANFMDKINLEIQRKVAIMQQEAQKKH